MHSHHQCTIISNRSINSQDIIKLDLLQEVGCYVGEVVVSHNLGVRFGAEQSLEDGDEETRGSATVSRLCHQLEEEGGREGRREGGREREQDHTGFLMYV